MEFDIQNYFIELGKLLYAIAKTDGIVQFEERKKVNEIVRDNLIEICKRTDEFGTNLAFYSEFSFDTISDRNIKADKAYQSFIAFVENHKHHIPETLIKLTISAVEKVAEAHQGIIEDERAFIEKLNNDLQNIYHS
ncbi:MAG TPA: hypothetical protein P5050_10185 [Bacteroidia bacterium]|nr:hypothetical protein [Bacteroidia bacterium]HRS59578.1 hypothetical protein [Bacteroidia bacterium]HRU67633.1 hypothetical protein [Bacteroidia bacterium]